MNNKKICPNCGNEMKLATYFSGSATGQNYKEKWICPKCRFIV